MRGALLLSILLIFAVCSAFEVSPENPRPGDSLIISGTASPGEEVVLRSSFAMHLPVASGRYEYQAKVEIPQKPNRFTVRANDVQDMNLGVKMGIWITKGFSASGKAASVSQQDIPPGSYELKIFGQALPGASTVEVDVSAETTVRADSSGKYRLAINTAGIPAGDYRIESAGQSKTIRLGDARESTPSGSSGSGGAEWTASTSSPPVRQEITPQVVTWYANQIGLDSDDPQQRDQAEARLKSLVKEDYWRVISRGDPLTEQAGNCQQDFCLVRGIDACTICREKEMLSQNLPEKNQTAQNSSRAYEPEGLTGQSIDPQRANLDQEGFISRILDWIKNMLARFIGG